MAILNILAKSKNNLKWENVLNHFDKFKTQGLEVFPIPSAIGFEFDCLGVCVHKNYQDRQIILSAISSFIKTSEDSIIFYELYDGVEINENNCNEIISRLLT